MRILIPISKLGRAGGYRVLSKLSDEFIAGGHQVDFIVSIYSDLPYFPTKARILWVDINGGITNRSDTLSRRGGLPSFCVYRALRRIKRNEYDVVLATGSLTTFPVYFSGIKSNLFYYIQAYEPEYFSILGGMKYKLLAFFSKQSYYLPFYRIVNAPLYKRYKNIRSDDVVLPGLDTILFHFKENWEQKPQHTWRLGTIGRNEPYKGTKYILEGFQKIRALGYNVELYLAFGDECLHAPENGVFVIKPDGDAHLAAFYRSTDIYISAGTVQHGAVHYPVIEAMSSGIAVLTTPYYPANDTNAWILKPADEDDLVRGFLNIYHCDEELFRTKKINAAESLKAFSWAEVGKKMISIFESHLK